ncbi:MAG: RNA-binding S4 domain-containing protein [Nocardiaceae bacterium]|nr:RNA-binding S4 domain-containing protein [Nocardiaceae bacterium]
MSGDPSNARVDSWIWAVRLFKTRSQAAAACRAGHVRVNGTVAKPATTVGPGDEVVVRGGDRLRIVEVTRPISKRVGPPVVAQCLIDKSPPPPPKAEAIAVRERGAGRPTKRDRREIDRLRGL